MHNCCLQVNLPLLSLTAKAHTSRNRPVSNTERHRDSATGLHWPSERSTQHSEDLLPVHFLLSSGCDDSKLLSSGSHWVVGCDTPIYLWEREKEPMKMKTKWLSRHLSSVSGSLIFTQLRVIDYIQDKNTDWVQRRSVLLLSGETAIVLHSSAPERRMR